MRSIRFPNARSPFRTRLARLSVETGDGMVFVGTSNVGCFSVDATQLEEARRMDIDGCTLAVPEGAAAGSGSQLYFQNESGSWKVGGFIQVSTHSPFDLSVTTSTGANRGGVTASSAAIHEPIYDPAFPGTTQNRGLWRFGLRIVDCTAACERSLRVPQAGRRYCL